MKKILTCLTLVLTFTPLVSGASIKEAMSEAANHFKYSEKISQNNQIVVSGVVNYHSQIKDQLSQRIETELYFAFGSQFPQVKLIDESESLAGVSGKNTVVIKGDYKQEGNTATLHLKAITGTMTGEVIDQVFVNFETQYRRRTLVAVLDIESKVLDSEQRRIFSDMFREALNELDVFELASSSDVDKMNPDEIQKATGCTRDTCATLIGEQLGVDRVISSSVKKLFKDVHVVSAKMMDIKDGSIVTTKSIEHEGSLRKLRSSLKILAVKLTEKLKQKPKFALPTVATRVPKPKSNDVVVDNDSGLMWQKGEPGKMRWYAAIEYCDSLELANHNDWRLPNATELKSSYEIQNKFSNLVNEYYWSSTSTRWKSAWGLTVSTGQLWSNGFIYKSYNVRCVRGGRGSETSGKTATVASLNSEKKKEIKLSKNIVLDRSTGLTWQKGEPGEMKWQNAMNYCHNLSLAEYNDWRLPDRDELKSAYKIITEFPRTYPSNYWSATTYPNDSDYAWLVYFDVGLVDYGNKIDSYYVRCVRGGQ